MLLSGMPLSALRRLRREGLHHGLLPMLDVILEQPIGERFVMLALNNTDARIMAEANPSHRAFLFAALLWHEVLATASKKIRDGGMASMPALFLAMDQVLDTQTAQLAIHRRYTTDMKELWALQSRLENRTGKRPFRVLEHPRFRAAYDFLQLRCDSGEVEAELGDWWRRFQQATPHEREGMLIKEAEPKRKRRRRRRPADEAPQRRERLMSRSAAHHDAWIALGSNLHDPVMQVRSAIDALNAVPGTRVVAHSSLYRSTPWGHADQPDFVNAVAEVTTELTARELLEALLALERLRGRVRTIRTVHAFSISICVCTTTRARRRSGSDCAASAHARASVRHRALA